MGQKLLVLVFLFIALVLLPKLPSLPTERSTPPGETALVARVIDGDTIELVNGAKVRYIGIDTAEKFDARSEVLCFGKEASDKNRELVEGKRVRLEKDISDTDKFGRLLRYVYLPAGGQGVGDVFVNDYLVRQGYAQVATFPPDVKYQQQFLEAQKEAREQKRGLWVACR